MKFGKTKGTEGLLKLTEQPEYSNLLRRRVTTDDTSVRRHARPVMHCLLSNAYVFLVYLFLCYMFSSIMLHLMLHRVLLNTLYSLR